MQAAPIAIVDMQERGLDVRAAAVAAQALIAREAIGTDAAGAALAARSEDQLVKREPTKGAFGDVLGRLKTCVGCSAKTSSDAESMSQSLLGKSGSSYSTLDDEKVPSTMIKPDASAPELLPDTVLEGK